MNGTVFFKSPFSQLSFFLIEGVEEGEGGGGEIAYRSVRCM